VYGDDIQTLRELSAQVRTSMRAIPGSSCCAGQIVQIDIRRVRRAPRRLYTLIQHVGGVESVPAP
jgi:Cu/Ag efflux pump CusA